MPIYEYRCPKCGVNFEVIRRIGEADKPATCQQCGAEAEKVISSIAYEHPKTWQLYVPDKKNDL